MNLGPHEIAHHLHRFEAVRRATEAHVAEVERELARLLGAWVSELEPEMVYFGTTFMGLGLKGADPVVVILPACPPIAPELARY